MPLGRQQALHVIEQQPDVLRDFNVTVSPETRNIMNGLLEALEVSGYSIRRSTGNQVDYLREFVIYMFEQLAANPREAAPAFFQEMSDELSRQGIDLGSSQLRNVFTTTLNNWRPIRSEAVTDFAYRFLEQNRGQSNS